MAVLGGTTKWPRGYGIEQFYGWAAFIIAAGGSVGLLTLGARVAGSVSYEKERDTWLTLLTTPMSAEEIVSAKLLGNLYAYRWLYLGLISPLCLGCLLKPIGIILIPLQLYILLITSMAASAAALLISLQVKSSVKAIGLTIGLILFCGGGYMPFAGLFAAIFRSNELKVLMMAPCVPFLLAVPELILIEFPYLKSSTQPCFWASEDTTLLAGLLVSAAIHRFDELAGRSAGQWQSPGMRREAFTSSSH